MEGKRWWRLTTDGAAGVAGLTSVGASVCRLRVERGGIFSSFSSVFPNVAAWAVAVRRGAVAWGVAASVWRPIVAREWLEKRNM